MLNNNNNKFPQKWTPQTKIPRAIRRGSQKRISNITIDPEQLEVKVIHPQHQTSCNSHAVWSMRTSPRDKKWSPDTRYWPWDRGTWLTKRLCWTLEVQTPKHIWAWHSAWYFYTKQGKQNANPNAPKMCNLKGVIGKSRIQMGKRLSMINALSANGTSGRKEGN